MAKRSRPTSLDRRIQFIKTMDGAEDPQFVEKLLASAGSLQDSQYQRLKDALRPYLRKTAIRGFFRWKSFFRTVGPELLGSSSEETLDRPGAQSVIKWIKSCQTVEEMIATMPHAPTIDKKQSRDIGLVSMALQYVVDKAHMVLECIFRDHTPPSTCSFYMLEDTLDLLTMRLRWAKHINKGAVAMELADLVVLFLVERKGNTGIQPLQSTIFRILQCLPPDRLKSWYHELCAASCQLSTDTELQFASRFAKSLDTKKLSLEILDHLTRSHRMDINQAVPLSVSTSILMFTKDELEHADRNMLTPAEVFGALRELGLNPNNFTYAAILRALCLRGDLKSAMEVFDVMKHHGIKPDVFTYSILVNGCRRSEAYEMLADIAVEASHTGVQDAVFWNDVIYAIHIACKAENKTFTVPRSTLFPLNTIFTRVFNPAKLRPFIIGPTALENGSLVDSIRDVWFPNRLRRLEREIPSLLPRELLEPGVDTLGIMILGMIRDLPQPYHVVVFYAHFKKLLQEGNPEAVCLVQERGTFVYDLILRSLVSWRGTMRVVLDIVRDMMKDNDQTSDSGAYTTANVATETIDNEQRDEAKRLDTVRAPPPSVHTWSILILGFMRHKQPEQAEQCIALMRQHGVEPNLVTWNSLTYGYAHLQDAHGVVHSLRRLETAGFKADDWTMRAFSMLRDREKAIVMMEEAVEANKREQQRAEQQRFYAQQELEHREAMEQTTKDTTLDADLDARFLELDPGTMPANLSEEMMEKVNDTVEQDTSSAKLGIDAALAELDVSGAHTIPHAYQKRYSRVVEQLQDTAPVDDKVVKRFDEWKRVRDGGLARMTPPPPKSLDEVESSRWKQ